MTGNGSVLRRVISRKGLELKRVLDVEYMFARAVAGSGENGLYVTLVGYCFLVTPDRGLKYPIDALDSDSWYINKKKLTSTLIDCAEKVVKEHNQQGRRFMIATSEINSELSSFVGISEEHLDFTKTILSNIMPVGIRGGAFIYLKIPVNEEGTKKLLS